MVAGADVQTRTRTAADAAADRAAAAVHRRPSASCMIDILLIQPPIRDFYFSAKRTQPYGLACVAAAARAAGFSVDLVDGLATSKARPANVPAVLETAQALYGPPDRSPFALFGRYRHFGYSIATLVERARASRAFLVGIASLFTAYEETALETAAAVRRALPDAHIVMGGHHATAFPERLLDHADVDFVLRGDGEVGLPALTRALREGTPLESVPGLAFRRPTGDRHLAPAAFVDQPDRLGPPALDLLRWDFYRRGTGGSAVTVGSRGCPLHCSYCCLGAAAGIPFRQRRVEAVLAELELAVNRHGARFIDFEDENLAWNRQWFMDLLEGIRMRLGSASLELRAMNGLYPPSLDPELIMAMGRAGFRTLNLALVSTDHSQLSRFRRRDVLPAFDRALSAAETCGLDAVGYIIAAAPHQPPFSSLRDLLALARRRVLAGLSIFYPAPGSADFELCRREGLLPSHAAALRATALPIEHRTSRLQAITLLRLARLLNCMKACLDADGHLPSPTAPLPTLPAELSRAAIGGRLLSWFTHDGALRGVAPDGEVFRHPVDSQLVTAFAHGLARHGLRGVRSPHLARPDFGPWILNSPFPPIGYTS